MPWKCPPLHLPNWNNLWKWKEQMNAKEFAHELEKAASFIRQQQAEIEALKSHPVKELTDEEIDNVSDEVSNLIDTYAGRREFARAILRKAQEK